MDKDPGYALAYVGVADSYTILASAAYDAMLPGEAMPKAKAAALKALELDPALGEAHVSLARVLSAYDWNFLEAEKEFKRTFELNPNYPSAHHFYAVHLMGMGREEEAVAEERRASSSILSRLPSATTWPGRSTTHTGTTRPLPRREESSRWIRTSTRHITCSAGRSWARDRKMTL